MRLPDLTTTEYVSVFAGSTVNNELSQFKQAFLNLGAIEGPCNGEDEGDSQLLISCTYQKNNIDHRAFMALKKNPEDMYGFGIEIEAGYFKHLDKFPKYQGVKAANGDPLRIVSESDFVELLGRMWIDAKLNSAECYFELIRIFNNVENIQKYMPMESTFNGSRLDIIYCTYGIDDQSAVLTVAILPNLAESESKVKSGDETKYILSYAIFQPKSTFSYVLPCPPKLSDLRNIS